MRTSIWTVLLAPLLVAGCVATDQLDIPEGGFYENEPVIFSATYDEVWNATRAAVRETGWFTRKTDQRKGIMDMMSSFVYNPTFDEYRRVYKQPSNKDLKKSTIRAYLRNISYYEKGAPPNPMFIKENMSLRVESISMNETSVKIDYKIMPFYDYKVGYLGTVRSRGRFEKGLFKRIQQMLDEKGG